ncbi:MAG TPA: dienelactone hydrolase family protein [Aestuariivirga sp.]
MDQKFINLFDIYTHGGMKRREFLKKLKVLAGTATLTPILAQLENSYAYADTVAPDDPRLITKEIEILPDIKGLLAMPKSAKGPLGGVMVIHENRGLNPHIKDIVRRVALEGFVAFGTDYLSMQGGTPADEDKARDMIGTLKPEDINATSLDVRDALSSYKGVNGKVGALGFCWGGGFVNALAVADPKLNAGVAYYGMQPNAADTAKIQAPLMLHYAGLDTRTNAGIPAFEAALKANNKTYEIYVYDGANHAFNNDTNAARYDKAAADLAWGRSMGWLKKYLN